jgi:hypothetical protein
MTDSIGGGIGGGGTTQIGSSIATGDSGGFKSSSGFAGTTRFGFKSGDLKAKFGFQPDEERDDIFTKYWEFIASVLGEEF